MRTDTKKEVKKVKQAIRLTPPVVPLKNYHKGYLADPNGTLYIPLVRQAHGGRY